MDKILVEKTSGQQTSEEEVISEKNIEEISGTPADLTGIEVGQGISGFQDILEKMTKVAVGQDQDQGQLQIETKLGA